MKVIDSRTFNISKTIALAEVTVEVGGMRELHVIIWSMCNTFGSCLIESPTRIVASYSA